MSFPVSGAGRGDQEGLLRTTSGSARTALRRDNPKVERQIQQELALITKLGFAGYFLIVWDIISFCREHDIMAQGRGSAANSAACFCLGITAVDPVKFTCSF